MLQQSCMQFRLILLENYPHKITGPYLQNLRLKIVDKCHGLPLAVKALDSLLYSRVQKREWDEILRSEIWGSANCNSSIVKIELPTSPFASKNYQFNKDNLILLWIVEYFLQLYIYIIL